MIQEIGLQIQRWIYFFAIGGLVTILGGVALRFVMVQLGRFGRLAVAGGLVGICVWGGFTYGMASFGGSKNESLGGGTDDGWGDGGEWPGEGGEMGMMGLMTLNMCESVETGFTEEQVARGFVVTGIGENEVWEFAKPAGGEAVEKWLVRGGFDDWADVRDWAVFPSGVIQDRRLNPSWILAPLGIAMGVVPEGNWQMLPEGVGASRVWSQTKTRSSLVTWENMLVEGETNEIVCAQAEFYDDGRIVYRYGPMSDSVRTNAVIGVWRAFPRGDALSVIRGRGRWLGR